MVEIRLSKSAIGGDTIQILMHCRACGQEIEQSRTTMQLNGSWFSTKGILAWRAIAPLSGLRATKAVGISELL